MLGKQLKLHREQKGYSQNQIAEYLGTTRQTISNWETEKFYPDILYVLQLSDLYQVSLDELLKGDEHMIQHLEDSTNTVKSNRKILLAFICNICLLFLFFIFVTPISKSYLLTLLAVALVTGTSGYILVQIIRKI